MIVQIRCEEEDVEMNDESMRMLATLGTKTSLRYVLQLITTASLIAMKRKASVVTKEDIRKAYGLFTDLKRSVEYLTEHEKEFLFGEEDGDAARMEAAADSVQDA